jgi:hypothetical protein
MLAAAGIIFCAAMLAAAAAMPDQSSGDTVGVIEGEAITVTGPMSVEVLHGQVKTIVRSGSDIQVKSGQARIDLVEGGQISICGPAHFSVLKSGVALTVALTSGTIHARIEREPALTVYTAQIQAKPMAIGEGPEEILVGFETPEAMCVRAISGAARIEQQLTGSSVVVPQGGNVFLTNARLDTLRNGAGHCACDLQVARVVPPAAPEANPIAPAEDARITAVDPTISSPTSPPASVEQPAEKEETVYQVFMPPLRFDASAKVQADPDPRMIVLVRRVRVRPTLIYQGRVEGDAVAAAAPPAAAPQPAPKAAPPAQNSVVDRVRTFFRRLWN